MLIGEPGKRIHFAEFARMICGSAGCQDALHIRSRDRTIANAALARFNFQQRLKPQQSARTVADQHRIKTAAGDFRFHRGSDRVRAH